MGRRNEHSREQQREMAISAAELLLVREGMAGFSMRKVAQAMGYTVGQLYLLFRNQDALFVVLNERTADSIYAALRDPIDRTGDPRERLRAAARAYIGFAEQHPSRWRLLYEHRLPAEHPVPEVNVLRVERIFKLVAQMVDEAVPGLSPELLGAAATALWSGVHGICVLAVTGKLAWSGVDDYGGLCDLLVDRFIDGLGRE